MVMSLECLLLGLESRVSCTLGRCPRIYCFGFYFFSGGENQGGTESPCNPSCSPGHPYFQLLCHLSPLSLLPAFLGLLTTLCCRRTLGRVEKDLSAQGHLLASPFGLLNDQQQSTFSRVDLPLVPKGRILSEHEGLYLYLLDLADS